MAFSVEVSNALLVGAAAANIIIGAVVLARNSQSALNRYFFGLSVGVTGWATTNILFRIVSQHGKFPAALSSYGFAAVVAAFFYLFCCQLTSLRHTQTTRWLVGLCAAVGVLSVVPGVVGISVTETGGIVTYRPALVVYGLVLTALIGAGIGMLLYRVRKASYEERAKIKLVILGLIAASTIGIGCNLILPLMDDYSYVAVGPAGTLIFVAATAYAIVKHRLFDIRLIVARSLGYVLSLIILASIYGFVVFGVAKYLFGLRISLATQIYLSGATGIAGLLFQRPIKLFNKATNQLFYQDSYDVQDLFDELNRTLVSSLNLSYLLKHVSELLTSSIKSEHVTFGLKSDDPSRYRIIGTSQFEYRKDDIAHVRAMTPQIHESVIVTDMLDESQQKLKQILVSNNVAVLVRLTPNVNRTEEGLGYIILGPKKSGNPYTNQDVRVLDTVANELVIAIQNALHFEEIQKFNITLQQRVNDATRQLRRTNAKLEALDETKDDFISMASHQLRTPLTSVKGYISMVLDGDAGEITPTQRKMLAQAFISSQRMVFLIADLLNVSRLKTGKFVIERAPVNLARLVAEEVAPLVETAQARGIKLTYAKPANFPALMLDETKTRQVVMNFVDNAIYYTKSGGHIDVQLADKPSSVELKVVDNGIGVPKAEQHHLFTKFYRARNAQKARPDGTGLGLYMAKKVILGQGGAIIFNSHEGQGSTFGFTFAKNRLQVIDKPVDKPLTSVKKPSKGPKKTLQKA